VQELARSWGCRAQGNGPEPRQHWRSGQKKSQPDKGWDFKLWWRNTEPNPRPRSSPESVRKPTVPILDHSADLAGIRQIGRAAISPGSMLPTGSQLPFEVLALRVLEKGPLDKMRHLY